MQATDAGNFLALLIYHLLHFPKHNTAWTFQHCTHVLPPRLASYRIPPIQNPHNHVVKPGAQLRHPIFQRCLPNLAIHYSLHQYPSPNELLADLIGDYLALPEYTNISNRDSLFLTTKYFQIMSLQPLLKLDEQNANVEKHTKASHAMSNEIAALKRKHSSRPSPATLSAGTTPGQKACPFTSNPTDSRKRVLQCLEAEKKKNFRSGPKFHSTPATTTPGPAP